MDVESTIEFILKAQATNEVQIGKLDAKIDDLIKMDARLARRIDGIGKLVTIGMRQIVKLADAQKRTSVELKELAKAQKATERSLCEFIDTLNKGGNGHKRGNGH